jgi:beta-1,4-mannosyltransferase
MDRRPRPPRQPPGAFTEEAVESVRAASATHPEPLLLGYYPAFTTNPYQALLYGRVREEGIAPVGIRRAETIAELTELQRAGLDTVLHVHWLHLVLRDAGSAPERAAAAFLGLLDAHLDAGGRVAWTVHNVLPHEARDETHEARLAAEVAKRADVIHVLAAGTPELVAPHFELPRDRLLHVPHPSYAGAYADHVSPLEARSQLGLAPDDLVYLVLGGIRAYKGIEELLDAWVSLPPDGRRRLVIAGAPSDEPGVDDLVTRAAVMPDTIVDARKLPADQIQVFLRAADIAVLPYRRALNSGALMLALTFGVPVVVPAGSGLAEVVDPSFAVTFEPGKGAGLAGALMDAQGLVTPAARAAAAAVADRFNPAELSRRFAEGLRELLARDGSSSEVRQPPRG